MSGQDLTDDGADALVALKSRRVVPFPHNKNPSMTQEELIQLVNLELAKDPFPAWIEAVSDGGPHPELHVKPSMMRASWLRTRTSDTES